MNKLSIFIFLIFCFSCKTETKTTPEDTYNKVANEFVAKLLELSEFSCSCIIEPSYTTVDYEEMERPELNKDYFMMRTNLKSRFEIDSINSLSRQVNLNKTITNNNYTLIPEKLAESIAMLRNRQEKERILDSICPKGFMVLSKPFFNKSMDTVLIIADDMPYSCFPSLIHAYYHINGEWIIPVVS
ncbi:hypothetical protein [Winogradskyella sp. PG-2]|uniref:hypothetical protein n=1 Tax=Winogradskyella sp. PG-2 TaxID=754409 RepID=UPI0004586822|nr:hypothetical protein [Winogradskyella sp. PG-2]BAO76286.1 hypothetical protein WPG_2056 [Winogradskyella sp. PG-2]